MYFTPVTTPTVKLKNPKPGFWHTAPGLQTLVAASRGQGVRGSEHVSTPRKSFSDYAPVLQKLLQK